MATTEYEVRDEFGQPQPPVRTRSRWTGCLIGCLAVFGILLLLGVIGGIWLANNLKSLAAKGVGAAIKQSIDQSNLPAEEKAQVKAEVERGLAAFAEGRISNEQAAALTEKFVNSPLMTTLAAAAAEKSYIDKSGLNEEERAEARITLQRFLRGSIDGDIAQASREAALSHVADKKPDGNWAFREKVGDEDLRAFVAEAKKAADEANVPEQPAKFDPSDEVKRIIDETLKTP